jgi:hypothetical protein
VTAEGLAGCFTFIGAMKSVHAGDAMVPAGKRNRSAYMTAETAPQPERQVRAQGAHQQMVRYGILLAAVAHVLVRDRRFQATVITRAIGAVALASLIKNNQVRPARRVAHWYNELGASHRRRAWARSNGHAW